MTNRKRIRIGYAIASFLILAAEVIIALYVRDAFIRPYGGDILVTLLLCCMIRIVLSQGYCLPIAGGVLVFAILVEVGAAGNSHGEAMIAAEKLAEAIIALSVGTA